MSCSCMLECTLRLLHILPSHACCLTRVQLADRIFSQEAHLRKCNHSLCRTPGAGYLVASKLPCTTMRLVFLPVRHCPSGLAHTSRSLRLAHAHAEGQHDMGAPPSWTALGLHGLPQVVAAPEYVSAEAVHQAGLVARAYVILTKTPALLPASSWGLLLATHLPGACTSKQGQYIHASTHFSASSRTHGYASGLPQMHHPACALYLCDMPHRKRAQHKECSFHPPISHCGRLRSA